MRRPAGVVQSSHHAERLRTYRFAAARPERRATSSRCSALTRFSPPRPFELRRASARRVRSHRLRGGSRIHVTARSARTRSAAGPPGDPRTSRIPTRRGVGGFGPSRTLTRHDAGVRSMYDMYPDPGAPRRTTRRTRAAARTPAPPSRPRLTCETTAASAPTTTRLRRMPDTDQTAVQPATPGAPTLAVIPGDGIGPEVTAEALKVLEVASPVKFESTRYDLGAERYLATGEVLPDSVLAEIRGHDAILLGAVGGKPNDPNLPPGILERGLLLKLRFELDHYVNLRPSRLFPGSASPLAGTSWTGRGRLRRRARGHRGPLHGQRRRAAGRHPGRDRDRGLGQHRVRRRARGPRRLRPGAEAAAQEAHAGPQDQRPGPRRLRSGGACSSRSAPSSPTSRPTTCTSTRP